VGMYLHYHKIVENEHFGYPIEWFPSVSATIGDRYPERSVFQVFIAICSGPRFVLVFLWYCLADRPKSSWPTVLAVSGVLRTLTCGGWTYVTSTDDHDWHDIFMISYLVLTLPWTIGCYICSPGSNPQAVKYRKYIGSAFFLTLIPLVYFFIQHKVHRVPGGKDNITSWEGSELTHIQPIPRTPSSNGLLYSSTSYSIPSRPWISLHSRCRSRMSRDSAEGMSESCRNSWYGPCARAGK
jgi:hypothetical protein